MPIALDSFYDLALCADTLQFLESRPLASAEMHRVLKPDGRAALSLWCDIRQNPYFHSLVQAVGRRIGPQTAAGLRAVFTGHSRAPPLCERLDHDAGRETCRDRPHPC